MMVMMVMMMVMMVMVMMMVMMLVMMMVMMMVMVMMVVMMMMMMTVMMMEMMTVMMMRKHKQGLLNSYVHKSFPQFLFLASLCHKYIALERRCPCRGVGHHVYNSQAFQL